MSALEPANMLLPSGCKTSSEIIEGTKSHGLVFSVGDIEPNYFVDSDYSGTIVDRRSMSGFIVKLWKRCMLMRLEERVYCCIIHLRSRVLCNDICCERIDLGFPNSQGSRMYCEISHISAV